MEVKINAILFTCICAAIPITFAWAYVLGRKDEHKIAIDMFDEALKDDPPKRNDAKNRQKKTVRQLSRLDGISDRNGDKKNDARR